MRVESVASQVCGTVSHRNVHTVNAPEGAFQQALAQAQSPGAANSAYCVQRGDTLSHIVLQALRGAGKSPSTAELYAAVRKVAASNNLADANVIHPGQTIDLSAILPQTTATVLESSAPTVAVSVPESAATTPDAIRPLQETLPLSAITALPERAPAATLSRPASRSSFRAARPTAGGISRFMGGPAYPHVDPTSFQLTASFSVLDPSLAGLAATPVSQPVRTALNAPTLTGTTPWGALLESEGRITSDFGPRPDPFTGRPDFHDGIDIAADFGSRIRPIGPGVVTFSGWQPGYGKMVIVRHDDGTETVYGHNAANLVRPGERVTADSVIALLGNTGRSTGPHLHFEARVRGRAVDPVQYLSRHAALQ